MRRRRRRRRTRRGYSLLVVILMLSLVIGIPVILVRSCTVSFFFTKKSPLVSLWNAKTQTLMNMTLEEYVQGVVAAEMPASFELEALKAQAVAARTYAYRRILRGDTIPDHPEAHLSTEYESGQAWLGWDDFFERNGLIAGRQLQGKIRRAVNETAGTIAVHEDEPILAVYHSTSGGRTENSEHYWSEKVPYLRSVSDPYSLESPYHFSTVSFPLTKLAELMEVDLGQGIRVVERYPSGRVSTIEIDEKWFSGRAVRQKLALRSTWFTVEMVDGEAIFSVWGYGHGVGMSQYGANGMAQEGYDYQEILKYYYQDIELTKAY